MLSLLCGICVHLSSALSFYAFHMLAVNNHYCSSELYSAPLMHSTDLALALRVKMCANDCYLLVLCISQTLLSLSTVIIAHASSTLLFLCIPQTWLPLSTVIIAHPSSILLFLCRRQTLLLLLTVISARLTCICSSYEFYRPCSHSQQSILHNTAEFNPAFLMHSTDLAFALNSHFCASKLHSPRFMDSTDLVLTLNCH